MPLKITCDPVKRAWTLRERGLDFIEAAEVFAGPTLDDPDERHDYGEVRVITVGYLRARMVVVGWTQRGEARHVFSMRKASEREKARYSGELDALRKRHEEG
ncbi:MAG: BrnT family toxin [Pseudolabrys sp.]|nr:BrnT family toxin [Pseudolabrys sp.]MSP32854.1 BrnT family toxin [Pseudolabrys sp.]